MYRPHYVLHKGVWHTFRSRLHCRTWMDKFGHLEPEKREFSHIPPWRRNRMGVRA